jgi:hypothetical protein
VDGPRPPRPVVRSRPDLGRRRACGARRAAADPRHRRDVAGQGGLSRPALRAAVPHRRSRRRAVEPHHSGGSVSGLGRAGQRRLPGPDARLRQTPAAGSAPPTRPFIKPFRYLVVYPALMRYIEELGTAGFPRPSAQPPDHPRPTDGIIPMSDAVAAATQLHPASPGEGADRFIPIGTDVAFALGHYLGRGLDAAFAHVIHVRDERSLRSSGSQVRRRGRTPCRWRPVEQPRPGAGVRERGRHDLAGSWMRLA